MTSSGEIPSRRRAAFTLVELLLGLTVLLAIGGVIVGMIPKSLDFAIEVPKRVRVAVAADAFDRSFDRDFAAIVPELGFDGDSRGCSFWTMRPQPDGAFDLRYVSYAAAAAGIRLATLAPAEFFAIAGTNAFSALPPEGRQALSRLAGETFAIRPAPFRYGGTNLEESVEIESWANPTNAPARVATAVEYRIGAGIGRLYQRRTRP